MPKRAAVETLEPLPAHNFQSNPAPADWNKKPKVDGKTDADSDSDDEGTAPAVEPEYRTATLPVTEGM